MFFRCTAEYELPTLRNPVNELNLTKFHTEHNNFMNL